MQYNFGTGLLTFTPSGSNPTPVQCGVLKDVTVDIDQAIKELRGQYKFPVDIAQAESKITGKAKFAQIFGAALTNILSGASQTTGSTAGAQNEVGTIPGTPFAVTVTNSATFVEDLGVFNVTTGLRMVRVASGPTTGQYSVSAGVYTFAAADTTNVVWISYSYTTVAGQTVELSNQLMGTSSTFTCTLFNTFKSKNIGIKLWSVVVPKLSLAMKNTDYMDNDIEFQAFANSSAKVLSYYGTE